jgi:hypothetical protein
LCCQARAAVRAEEKGGDGRVLRRSLRGVDDWRRWLSAERAWSWLVQVRPHAWQFVSLATVALLLLLRVDKDLSDLPYLVPAFFSGLSRRVY